MQHPMFRVTIPQQVTPTRAWHIPSSKSDLNRYFLLSALLCGETTIHGQSNADDVVNMITCLQTLGITVESKADRWLVNSPGLAKLQEDTKPKTLAAGAGGTTVRFLMALLSALPARNKLVCHEQILRRPNEAWVRALESLGASIERDATSFTVTGAKNWKNEVAMEVCKGPSVAD